MSTPAVTKPLCQRYIHILYIDIIAENRNREGPSDLAVLIDQVITLISEFYSFQS